MATVLLVASHEFPIVDLLREFLELAGVNVIQAHNGYEGLEIMHKGKETEEPITYIVASGPPP